MSDTHTSTTFSCRRMASLRILLPLFFGGALALAAPASGHLHPELGRFCQRDSYGTELAPAQLLHLYRTGFGAVYPAAAAAVQYSDGANLYEYLRGHHNNAVDPSGMSLDNVIQGIDSGLFKKSCNCSLLVVKMICRPVNNGWWASHLGRHCRLQVENPWGKKLATMSAFPDRYSSTWIEYRPDDPTELGGDQEKFGLLGNQTPCDFIKCADEHAKRLSWSYVYHWSGPNSNTFISSIVKDCSAWCDMPARAWGGDDVYDDSYWTLTD